MNCFLCPNKNISSSKNQDDTYSVECKRCGKYIVTREVSLFNDEKQKIKKIGWALSGLSRRKSLHGENPLKITTKFNIEDYPEVPDKFNIEKKALLLLDYIKTKTSFFGEEIYLNTHNDYPLAFAMNIEELLALIELLHKKEYIQKVSSDSMTEIVTLSERGLNFRDRTVLEKQVFIASYFNDDQDSYIKAVEDTVKKAGYLPMCLKYEHYNQTIFEKALTEIKRSKFVVVNLNEYRGAVLFEAGFSQALEIPIIYICHDKHKDDKESEFYTSHYKIYYYKDVKDLKEILQSAISVRF